MREPHFAFLLLLFAFSVAFHGRSASAQPGPLFACDTAKNPQLASLGFCNRSLPVEARVSDLLGRLTVTEKLGFLPSKNGPVDRLGIPAYEWWSEALHGVSDVGPGTHFTAPVPGATSFPQVLLTAASFNATLFETIGKVVSTEARAMHNVGLAGLTYWSPNVNIFRDPRWGRGQETPGEDPVLASKYAVSYVRGLQTAEHDPNALKVAACCKHYTAYDVDNWKGVQRYSFNALVSKQDLDDTYQPPFKSCVVDGNVASVMCSYNQVNGVPTCADPDLLSGTIRGEWKLNGYIVSDCDSVQVLFDNQHYTKTPEEAVAKSILAGLDLNCGSFVGKYAAGAVANGLLPVSAVDKAFSNNVATLIRLGFFDGDPRQLPYGNLGPKDVCTTEHQELAREAARQGTVLLKNEGGVLPLQASAITSLAVIGPNANVTHTMLGNYEGKPCSYITPLQGLAAVVPTVYTPGCTNVACAGASLQLDQAKAAASQADATVLVVGLDQSIERESLDRVDLLFPGQQAVLISEVAKAAKGPVILVIMSAGPIDVSFVKADDRIPGILWIGYPGEKGGGALADIIFGAYNPSGRLPVTWYPQSYVQNFPMTDMNMRPNPATGNPGRTYRFYKGDVVYPFGAGLSYTTVKHHLVQAPKLVALQLDESHPCRSQRCKSVQLADDGHCGKLAFGVRLRVQNLGDMDVRHTVFLFSSPPSVHNSPVKHLVGFEKVYLRAKEAKEVAFQVDVCKDLSVVDEAGDRKVALGPHVLHIGDLMHSLNMRI